MEFEDALLALLILEGIPCQDCPKRADCKVRRELGLDPITDEEPAPVPGSEIIQ